MRATTGLLPRLLRLALYAAAGLIIAAAFNFGFRATADQRSYAEAGFNLPWTEWLAWSFGPAASQGRIGYIAVGFLEAWGGYVGDMWFFPALCLAIFFGIVAAFFGWVQMVGHQKVAVALCALYVALLPLGLHHWLPNAYPMHFLLLALGLAARLLFLRIEPKTHWLGLVPLALLIFLGALSYELCLALTAVMTAAEAALWSGSRNAGAYPSARYVRWQVAIVALAIVAYTAFRFAHPSTYGGNQLPTGNWLRALQSVGLHIQYALATSHWFPGGTGGDISVDRIIRAIVVGLAIAVAIARLEPPRFSPFWLVVGAAVIAATVVPIAANEKYVGWCLDQGDCSYLDSRFALLGIATVVLFALSGLLKWRPARFVFALLIGFVGGTTYVSNIGIRNTLGSVQSFDDQAKAHVCANPSPGPADAAMIEHLVQSPVTFHPHYDATRRAAYWTSYLAHLRSTPMWTC